MTAFPIHTLVHIGAGCGNQLPYYQELNLTRLILIEPLPGLARHLRQATASMPNTEVWELAVSNHTAPKAELTEYNLTQVSSLHHATGLLTLYPGLKALQQHQVIILSPQELMERLQLNPDHSHQLILEANGEEQAIINTLLDHDQLSLFQHIQIIMSEQALYKSLYNPDELRKKLEKHCFELLEVDNDDPDFPLWKLALNPTKVMLKTSQTELQKNRQAIAQLIKEIVAHDKTRQEHETLIAQTVEKNKQLNLQLAESKNLIQEQQQQLNVLKKNIQAETIIKDKAQKQCDNLAREQESLQHQLKQLTIECYELKTKDTEQRHHLSRLHQEITAEIQEKEKTHQHSKNITQERNTLAQDNEQLTNKLSSLEKENTEYRQQLTSLQQQLKIEIHTKEQTQQEYCAIDKERDALLQDKNQLTKELSALKEKEKILVELQKKHAVLQHDHQKARYENQQAQLRQMRLEKELLKAEAQIELIKDLMLNDRTI